MRRTILAAVAVLLSFAIISPVLHAAEPSDHQTQLAKSRQTWETLKAKCGGNYSYKIRWSSWVGFGHETTIVVRENKVAQRHYREWKGELAVPMPVEPGQPQPPQPEGESWVEQGDTLGSHKKGAPLKTLDELYDEAAKILATQLEPFQQLYVRFDGQGLLASCFYVDTRIADDAPTTGVIISGISLELPKTR